jgi:hypothetical protein
LYCWECTSLTSLPLENCTGLQELYCDDCPWIPQQNPEYENNLRKLIFLQRSRRRSRMRKFLGLCRTEAFCRYFYSPDNMGGKWAKTTLRKMCREPNTVN